MCASISTWLTLLSKMHDKILHFKFIVSYHSKSYSLRNETQIWYNYLLNIIIHFLRISDFCISYIVDWPLWHSSLSHFLYSLWKCVCLIPLYVFLYRLLLTHPEGNRKLLRPWIPSLYKGDRCSCRVWLGPVPMLPFKVIRNRFKNKK